MPSSSGLFTSRFYFVAEIPAIETAFFLTGHSQLSTTERTSDNTSHGTKQKPRSPCQCMPKATNCGLIFPTYVYDAVLEYFIISKLNIIKCFEVQISICTCTVFFLEATPSVVRVAPFGPPILNDIKPLDINTYGYCYFLSNVLRLRLLDE